MDVKGVQRLEHKRAQEAIIARICEDLHLAPFLARAYYHQMADYFAQYAGVELQENQVVYCAVAAEEPPGRRLSECRRVPVRLTLHEAADRDVAARSLPALRRRRIVRLCTEAHDQEGVLTQEDLALLLTTSRSTIKRDLKALREQGHFPPTRGQHQDMGPGVSHKVDIIRRYLAGESLTDIGRHVRHGLESMTRYLQAFRQVALMTREGLAPPLLRRATRLSAKLISEYQALFAQARDDPNCQARLDDLLGPSSIQKGGPRR